MNIKSPNERAQHIAGMAYRHIYKPSEEGKRVEVLLDKMSLPQNAYCYAMFPKWFADSKVKTNEADRVRYIMGRLCAYLHHFYDKPTVVSLLGAAVSAALMVAFAIAYRIAGLFVPDTNAVMVAVHGIISLCGNILMFSTIAAVASVIYSKLCDDRAIAERFAKPPKSSAVSSVLTRIAFAAIMICAVGFVIEVVGMSPIAIFLEATGALEANEAFLHGLEIILSCVCKVSFIVAVLLAFAAYKARWEL